MFQNQLMMMGLSAMAGGKGIGAGNKQSAPQDVYDTTGSDTYVGMGSVNYNPYISRPRPY